MNASLSAAWLQEGPFDLGGPDPRHTTMISIKETLSDALRLPPDGLRIAFYPPGPQFKHTYWWREGGRDYAEAQFVAAIAKEVPVLSLGVSIEKGFEAGVPGRPEQVMDRAVWDWPRLVSALPEILSVDVPGVAAKLAAPISVRVHTGIDVAGEPKRWWRVKAFTFFQDHWWHRHGGRVLLQHQDHRAIREAVEVYGLAVADDATLFEVICAFDIIDCLPAHGWTLTRSLGLFGEPARLRLRATRGTERLDLVYQQAPSALVVNSVYRSVQEQHGFANPSTLRPDLVLRKRSAISDEWLLIEVKLGDPARGGRSVSSSARAALIDLLAYRRDFGSVLGGSRAPYGLGIAWGAGLEPAPGEVMLTTRDHIAKAMATFLT